MIKRVYSLRLRIYEYDGYDYTNRVVIIEDYYTPEEAETALENFKFNDELLNNVSLGNLEDAIQADVFIENYLIEENYVAPVFKKIELVEKKHEAERIERKAKEYQGVSKKNRENLKYYLKKANGEKSQGYAVNLKRAIHFEEYSEKLKNKSEEIKLESDLFIKKVNI